MADPPGSIDLSFVSRDVRNQIAHSRHILTQVQALKDVLQKVENPDARAQIERSINELLTIAGGLTNNATTTSSNTVLTIVTSTGKST